jgi:hypothetical protein
MNASRYRDVEPTRAAATLTRLFALAAMAVAIVAYLPSVDAGLVSDDFFFTRKLWGVNLLTHLASPWEHQLGRATAYRPLTVFTYGLNQALWNSPRGFHALNILAHAVASAMCVLLAGRLGLKPAFAGLAGIAFALHPVHHEAVSWIAGRTAVLSGAFSLASLWAMCRWAGHDRSVWAASGLATLALLSYEGPLLLPFVLLAVALYTRPHEATRRALITALLPVAITWALYLIVRWTVFSNPERDAWALSSAVTNEGFAAPVLRRATDNVHAFVARLLAAGVGLPPLQSRTFVVTSSLAVGSVIVALRRGDAARVLLAVLVAAAGFVPFVTYTGYADRFAYFPSAGLCLVLALGAERAWASGWPSIRPVLAAALAIMLALWTRQLLLTQADWVQAGRVAAAIPAQARRLVPTPPPGAHVRVLGVPLGLGAAYVYITYFDLAMRQSYGRDDVTFSMSPDPTAVCDQESQPGPLVCLRWDGTTNTMSAVQGS